MSNQIKKQNIKKEKKSGQQDEVNEEKRQSSQEKRRFYEKRRYPRHPFGRAPPKEKEQQPPKTSELKFDPPEETERKRAQIDQLMMEESIFSQKMKCDAKVEIKNERIFATDNYSDLMLSIVAVVEYKFIVDKLGPQAKQYMQSWSIADHVFMRREQLQMILSTQEAILDLRGDIPSLHSVYADHGISHLSTTIHEIQEMLATKVFWKVLLSYLPSRDVNGNTYVFLPYRYRHENNQIIGLNNDLSYEMQHNHGMVDPVSYVKSQGSRQWALVPINPGERVRRYDPLIIQHFIYDRTRGNQQLQGHPPAPGNISFQAQQLDTTGFNQLFGCHLLSLSYSDQAGSLPANRFINQQLHHGIFFHDQVLKFTSIIKRFNLDRFLISMSFEPSAYGAIKRNEFRPVLWGERGPQIEDTLFTVQGSANHQIMSPFIFYDLQQAQGWRAALLRAQQMSYGSGDFTMYNVFAPGVDMYQLRERDAYISGLQLIMREQKDTVFSPYLITEM